MYNNSQTGQRYPLQTHSSVVTQENHGLLQEFPLIHENGDSERLQAESKRACTVAVPNLQPAILEPGSYGNDTPHVNSARLESGSRSLRQVEHETVNQEKVIDIEHLTLNPLASEFVPSVAGVSRAQPQNATRTQNVLEKGHALEAGTPFSPPSTASSAALSHLPRNRARSDHAPVSENAKSSPGETGAGNRGPGNGQGGRVNSRQRGSHRGGLSAALQNNRNGQGSVSSSANAASRSVEGSVQSYGKLSSGQLSNLTAHASPARGGQGEGAENRLGDTGPGTTPPGRRGQGQQNANHLLNFRYEPIQRASPGRGRGSYYRRQSRPPPPFNKELFLQANFRFLVSDLGDYNRHAVDPDKTLDWHQVAAVEVEETAIPQCPICLEAPPLCPQITACGHMFCFPCIVRYLMVGKEDRKENWKKCPLCFATIGTSDLRSAKVHVAMPPSQGDTLRFSLLVRSKHSIIPFESSVLFDGAGSLTALPFSENGKCFRFAKFTLTSAEGAEAVATAGEAELMALAMHIQNNGGLEDRDQVPYILAAVDLLQQRKQVWAKHRADDFMSSSPPVQKRIMAQTKLAAPSVLQEKGAVVEASKDSLDKELAKKGPVVALTFAQSLAANGSGAEATKNKVADVSAETDVAMARLKQEASWVYKSAFSDEEEGADEVLKGRMIGKGKGKKGKGRQEGKDQAIPSPSQESKRNSPGKNEVPLGSPSGMSASMSADFKAKVVAEGTYWEEISLPEEEPAGESSASDLRAPGLAGAQNQSGPSENVEDKKQIGLKSGPEDLAKLGVEGSAGQVAVREGASGEGKKGPQAEGEERSYYMFYQAEDGRPLFLHTTSMKCLLQHYGNYESLPARLEGDVLEVNTETQIDVTRKRLKFLNHLPLTATFSLVDVDVAKLVPPSAMAPFADELRQRELRRLRKIQQEEEERARAEKAAVVRKGPQVPSPEDFIAILSAMDENGRPEVFETPDQPAATFASSEEAAPQSRISFSRVAKMGYASGVNAPEPLQNTLFGDDSIAANHSPPGPLPLKGAWGAPMRDLGSGSSPAPAPIGMTSALPWGLQSGHQSIGSSTSQTQDRLGASSHEEAAKGGQKKKKKGATLLMSTNLRRG